MGGITRTSEIFLKFYDSVLWFMRLPHIKHSPFSLCQSHGLQVTFLDFNTNMLEKSRAATKPSQILHWTHCSTPHPGVEDAERPFQAPLDSSQPVQQQEVGAGCNRQQFQEQLQYWPWNKGSPAQISWDCWFPFQTNVCLDRAAPGHRTQEFKPCQAPSFLLLFPCLSTAVSDQIPAGNCGATEFFMLEKIIQFMKFK